MRNTEYSRALARCSTEEEREAFRKRRRDARKEWLARQTPEKQAEMRELNRIRSSAWYHDPAHKEQIRKNQRAAALRYYYRHVRKESGSEVGREEI